MSCYKCNADTAGGRVVAGDVYCRTCTQTNSDADLIERVIREEQWLLHVFESSAAKHREKIERYQKELSGARGAVNRGCLAVVGESAQPISKWKASKILKASRNADRFERRQAKIEEIGSPEGAIQIRRTPNGRLHTEVFLGGELIESFSVAQTYRYRILRCLNEESRRRIPWKKISGGQAWDAQVRLSGYYLYDRLLPKNLITLPANRSSGGAHE